MTRSLCVDFLNAEGCCFVGWVGHSETRHWPFPLPTLPRKRGRVGRVKGFAALNPSNDRRSHRLVACSLTAITVFFANTPAAACDAPQRPMQQIELMFGRNVASHLWGGEAAWSRFLAREITPRFPDGLTVLDAAGQWRDPAGGRVMREPSKMVIIVTAEDAPVHDRIASIVAAYKRQFRQRSVGVISRSVCAAF